MASDLPTQKELEKLYREKGKEAVLWYAWRNSLRALPTLGSSRLENIWRQETWKHTYHICMLHILLAKGPNSINFLPNGGALGRMNANITHDVISAVNTIYLVKNAFTSGGSNAEKTARLAAQSARSSAKAAPSRRCAIDLSSAAKEDYTYILSSGLAGNYFRTEKPLWMGDSIYSVTKNLRSFRRRLENIGLSFLAEDLKYLYEMQNNSKPFPKHWDNYALDISDVESNDPDALRAIILGDSADINAVRVLLLGPGGAGKSTLYDRLLNKDVEIQKAATKGLFLENTPLSLGKDSAFTGMTAAENLELFCWDFGGQTLFYGLHKSFLHENCVYVLVVDSRHEQAPDDWLHQINHLSKKKNTTVLLVSNDYEGCHYKQNEQRLIREFGESLDLSFHYFACNKLDDGEGALHKFKQELLVKAGQSRHVISQNLMTLSNKLENNFEAKPIVSLENLLESLELDSKNEEEHQGIIDRLKGLGRLVAIDADDGQRLCVDPVWVIDRAYQLLFFDCLKAAEGLVSEALLRNEVEKKIKEKAKAKETGKESNTKLIQASELHDLVSFLENSRICVKVNSKLFFPDLAPFNEPEKLPEKQSCVAVALHFPYLPIGLFARLVSHWMQQSRVNIASYKEVWREGFVLRHQDDRNSGIWLEYLSRKSVIQLNCFGQASLIADMLSCFWEALTSLKVSIIFPIQAKDILPLLSIDTNYFNAQHHDKLEQASAWLQDFNEIERVFNKIEESSKMSKTEINLKGNKGHVTLSTGDNSKQKITHINYPKKITVEQKNTLLQALLEIKEAKVLTESQYKKIAVLEKQVEDKKIVPSQFQEFIDGINLAGSVASIASITGLLNFL